MSNRAKDWQVGYYTVMVDGKTIAASKKVKTGMNKQGFPIYKDVTVTSRCSPEDEFSLSMGVALAMDRLSKKLSKDKIEVGDKVRIKDAGLSYPTHIDWVKKNINDVGLAACFAYDQIPATVNANYIVKAMFPWCNELGVDKNNILAYVQRYFMFPNGRISDNQPCYLIRIDGLEKV